MFIAKQLIKVTFPYRMCYEKSSTYLQIVEGVDMLYTISTSNGHTPQLHIDNRGRNGFQVSETSFTACTHMVLR